jgi:endoglucanase
MKSAKVLLTAVLIFCAATLQASVVSDNGWLRVDGTALVNKKGNPIQLRGVSMGWHCLWPRFYNHTVVDKLAQNWHADIVRCSIGLDLEDKSFEQKPELGYAVADSIIQAAIANDIYVLVDFHSHANNLPLAKEFFTNISKKYGKYPNLLYEIWNEPMEVQWQETKEYAEELIPIIRKNAPKSIIIVPTPRWDQNVDDAANDPIVGINNIMYSLHYYAATHTDYLRDKAQYALSKGLPIFMSECASMVHTGDGVIDTKSWEQWMQIADDNKISWIAWSISDKDETCSMLRPSASSDASQWSDNDLKAWAVLVKYYLKRNR